MKVIMIGSHLRVTGGITRVVKNYINAGIGKKVDMEYFPTYLGSNHFVNIIYFIIQYIKLVLRISLLNQKFDLAHIHMSYRGSFVRKRKIINLLHRNNIPIVLHMHGSQFKDYFNESSAYRKRQIKDTLNKVSVILALGEQWKEFYQTISTSKVVSLNNAVFPKETNKNIEEKVYITTMGVLSKRKGTYDLIEVASKLKDKIDPKYKFLIAGDGDVDKVKSKINQLGLEDFFIVPGWISDEQQIANIYRKSIIYVLPSYNEGMPMSILEAMSYGLPVISTNVGSISSVIKDGENGILVKPGEVDNIAREIEYLLKNTDVRLNMQKKNVDIVLDKFNLYENIGNLVGLYEKVTE